MSGLKYNGMGIIENAVRALPRKESDAAFVLTEFGNNLALVMRGQCTLEEFAKVYVGWEHSINIDEALAKPKARR